MDSMIDVETVAKTPTPDEVSFYAARQDYFDGYVYDHTIDELLESTEHETIESYLHKRMDRSEWGVFEHPTISLGVKGIESVSKEKPSERPHRLLRDREYKSDTVK